MIEFTWPPKILSPNGRTKNFRYRNLIFQKYKSECFMLTKASKMKPTLTPIITFYPKSSAQDKDNAIAAFKAGQDGLALAWDINDRELNPDWRMGKATRKNARITVEAV